MILAVPASPVVENLMPSLVAEISTLSPMLLISLQSRQAGQGGGRELEAQGVAWGGMMHVAGGGSGSENCRFHPGWIGGPCGPGEQ